MYSSVVQKTSSNCRRAERENSVCVYMCVCVCVVCANDRCCALTYFSQPLRNQNYIQYREQALFLVSSLLVLVHCLFVCTK